MVCTRTSTRYGNGDSGIYPGSGPEGHCKRYGIEIRNVTSHDNVLGYSGTAGNGTWTHNSKFHDNNAGISDDSFASGPPGHAAGLLEVERQPGLLEQPELLHERPRHVLQEHAVREAGRRQIVCPQFQVPVGSGFILYGVNCEPDPGQRDLRQLALGGPPVLGAGGDPRRQRPRAQFDTSNGNQFIGNQLGFSASGKRAPNGVDFFWDEEGKGNCWLGNQAPGGKVTSDPASLPRCPNNGLFMPANASKSAAEVPCAQWDPKTNPDPPGCTWFTTPPKPSSQ